MTGNAKVSSLVVNVANGSEVASYGSIVVFDGVVPTVLNFHT